jgi:hypothetical protein
MRRLAFIVWCIGSLCLWAALVFATVHFVLSRVWYEIPVGFYEAVNNGTLWIARRFKPEYDPGILQMDDPGQLLLIAAIGLICAAVVIRISTVGWRRLNARRRKEQAG